MYACINAGENLMKFAEFCLFGIYEVVALPRFVKLPNSTNIETLMSCASKRALQSRPKTMKKNKHNYLRFQIVLDFNMI